MRGTTQSNQAFTALTQTVKLLASQLTPQTVTTPSFCHQEQPQLPTSHPLNHPSPLPLKGLQLLA